MVFDALSIMGITATVLCGGFLIALIKRNDSRLPRGEPEAAPEEGGQFDPRP